MRLTLAGIMMPAIASHALKLQIKFYLTKKSDSIFAKISKNIIICAHKISSQRDERERER